MAVGSEVVEERDVSERKFEVPFPELELCAKVYLKKLGCENLSKETCMIRCSEDAINLLIVKLMEKSWKIDVNNTFQPQLVVYSYPKNVREPKGVVFKILDHACYETKFGEKESRKGQCIACNTNFSTLENETEKNISDEKRAAVKQVPDKGIKDETENILIAVDVVKKSGLTSEECDAFIDYVICGIHTENIAAKKGVSKNAVRKQRSRARGKIEVFLKSLDDNRRY